MGIRPYKAFTFDGKSSLDYGVYLTGEGVFNAPERAVEMLEIPGRNGSFILDQGRFQNISVTYKAGIVDYSETDFATRVSNVRNWLCSKVGYKRLEDDYNPNEYRMAAFVAGIEVDHADLQTGEFEITFDCKPQRWLTSGETAVTVADGGTLNNPTPFDASPLLMVRGYGNIAFNGSSIGIENIEIGDVLMSLARTYTSSRNQPTLSNTQTLQNIFSLNAADTFTVDGKQVIATAEKTQGISITACTISSTTNCTASYEIQNGSLAVTIDIPSMTFTRGTNSSATDSSVTLSYTWGNGNVYNRILTIKTKWSNSGVLLHTTTWSSSSQTPPQMLMVKVPEIHGYSTKSALGNPTYIDCENGECYMINNGEISSLNNTISLGSDLPKLSSGVNTFAYDNTVTSLEVEPRWWKV